MYCRSALYEIPAESHYDIKKGPMRPGIVFPNPGLLRTRLGLLSVPALARGRVSWKIVDWFRRSSLSSLTCVTPTLRPSLPAVLRGRSQTFSYSIRFLSAALRPAMASATTIHLSPATDSGVFSSGVREDAARTASELLQEDMELHHVFFNNQGFHSRCFLLIFFLFVL